MTDYDFHREWARLFYATMNPPEVPMIPHGNPYRRIPYILGLSLVSVAVMGLGHWIFGWWG